jgi:ribonuclease inhibitor
VIASASVNAPLEIDLSLVQSEDELHRTLAASLSFPAWYGRNWDAFWDCITDNELSRMPQQLTVRGWASLRDTLPQAAALLRSCLDEWSRATVGAHVEWLDD